MGELEIPGTPRDARRRARRRGTRACERWRARARAIRQPASAPTGSAPFVDEATTAESAAPNALGATRAGASGAGKAADSAGPARTARQRVADRRGRQPRRGVAGGSGCSRPHPLTGWLCRLVIGGDGRAGQRVTHRPCTGRPGTGRDCRPLRARAHRLAAGHDRRSPAEPRRADASPGKRAGPDRADPCAARFRDARRPDRSSAPSPPRHPARGAARAAAGHLLDRGRGAHVHDPARRGHARCIRSRRADVAHRPHDRRGSRRPRLGRRHRARPPHRPRAVRARRRSPPGSVAVSTGGAKRSGCSRHSRGHPVQAWRRAPPPRP